MNKLKVLDLKSPSCSSGDDKYRSQVYDRGFTEFKNARKKKKQGNKGRMGENLNFWVENISQMIKFRKPNF